VFLRGNARQQHGTHNNGFHECRHFFLSTPQSTQ
jgi:hypothetical protein